MACDTTCDTLTSVKFMSALLKYKLPNMLGVLSKLAQYMYLYSTLNCITHFMNSQQLRAKDRHWARVRVGARVKILDRISPRTYIDM